jgi:hypothetical protein
MVMAAGTEATSTKSAAIHKREATEAVSVASFFLRFDSLASTSI